MDISIKIIGEELYRFLISLPLRERVVLVAKLIIVPYFSIYVISRAYRNLKGGMHTIVTCLIGSGFMFGYFLLDYYLVKIP